MVQRKSISKTAGEGNSLSVAASNLTLRKSVVPSTASETSYKAGGEDASSFKVGADGVKSGGEVTQNPVDAKQSPVASSSCTIC